MAIAGQAVAALERHRRYQLEERLIAGPAWGEGNYVFTNEIGQPLHRDSISKRFHEFADATELPRIRLHDLRHSARRCCWTLGFRRASSATGSGTPTRPSSWACTDTRSPVQTSARQTLLVLCLAGPPRL